MGSAPSLLHSFPVKISHHGTLFFPLLLLTIRARKKQYPDPSGRKEVPSLYCSSRDPPADFPGSEGKLGEGSLLSLIRGRCYMHRCVHICPCGLQHLRNIARSYCGCKGCALPIYIQLLLTDHNRSNTVISNSGRK